MEQTERAPRADETVAVNRKARHDYLVLETFEVGIALLGTEIKSVRAHRVNLKDSYAHIKGGELWLENCHISPWEKASWSQHDPLRPRKLLVHKTQLRKLSSQLRERGLTMTALKMYLKGGRYAKIELALVKGKTQGDKRMALKAEESKRDIARELRNRS